VSKSPYQEWGAAGGRTTALRRTAEQRKQAASKAHLGSCVAAIVAKAPELTPEQIVKLRAIFGPVTSPEADPK
jgi:hypothetical protein